MDGPLLAASLAQPSGLTHDGTHLFVADSEISSIRAIDLDPRGGHVKTVLGHGLFDFGDVDGGPDEARLQHPLDVEYVEGTLFVADTYNNKIKTVGLHTRSAKTFVGSGAEGMADGPGDEATFDEPAGISHAGGKLYVADTNNHAIRVVDIVSREVSTLRLLDAERLTARRPKPTAETMKLRLRPGPQRLRLEVALPEGMKLNPDAASEVSLRWNGEFRVFPLDGPALEVDFEAGKASGTLEAEVTVYYCEGGREGLCYFASRRVEAEVSLVDDADAGALLRLSV